MMSGDDSAMGIKKRMTARKHETGGPTTMAYLMLTFADPITGDTRGGTVVVPIHGFTPSVLTRLTNAPMHDWYPLLLRQSAGTAPMLELMEPLTLNDLMGNDEPDGTATRQAIDRLVNTRECITASITMDAPNDAIRNAQGTITRSVYQLTLPAPDNATLLGLLGMMGE